MALTICVFKYTCQTYRYAEKLFKMIEPVLISFAFV